MDVSCACSAETQIAHCRQANGEAPPPLRSRLPFRRSASAQPPARVISKPPPAARFAGRMDGREICPAIASVDRNIVGVERGSHGLVESDPRVGVIGHSLHLRAVRAGQVALILHHLIGVDAPSPYFF